MKARARRPHPRDNEEHSRSTDWDMDIVLAEFKIHWRGNADAEIERIETGRRVSMEEAEKADKKKFLGVMLKFKWLPDEIRYAVAHALGRSVRMENKAVHDAIAETRRVLVEERKATLAKRGGKLRGGIHAAAIEEVAREANLSPKGLEKTFERATRRRKKAF